MIKESDFVLNYPKIVRDQHSREEWVKVKDYWGVSLHFDNYAISFTNVRNIYEDYEKGLIKSILDNALHGFGYKVVFWL